MLVTFALVPGVVEQAMPAPPAVKTRDPTRARVTGAEAPTVGKYAARAACTSAWAAR